MQTLEQLKAHAYDCLHNIEMWQQELKATNDLINKKAQEEATKSSTPMPEVAEVTGTETPEAVAE